MDHPVSNSLWLPECQFTNFLPIIQRHRGPNNHPVLNATQKAPLLGFYPSSTPAAAIHVFGMISVDVRLRERCVNSNLLPFGRHHIGAGENRVYEVIEPNRMMLSSSSFLSSLSIPTTSITRGDFPSRPLALYLCSLLVESMLIYFIRKLCMSPFTWGMVALYAATGYRVIDQNEEECMQTPGEHHCAKQ